MSGKYGRLVFELPAEHNESSLALMGGVAGLIMSPQVYFRGATQIPGARFNAGFQIFVKSFFLDRIPHHHDVDEYLVFLGASSPNVFDFNAEIELTMGKAGVDAEVYRIDKPTIVRIPSGVTHCPINFIRVDAPVFFQPILMQDMFSSIYETEDGGTKELWYNGPHRCKLNPDRECDSCRGCIEEDWQ